MLAGRHAPMVHRSSRGGGGSPTVAVRVTPWAILAAMHDRVERLQAPIYAGALAVGLTIGLGAPHVGERLEPAIWPALAVLLYATFSQIPLAHMGAAACDRRFAAALVLGNFVAVPVLVFAITRPVAGDRAVLLGLLLVLLAPCIDWFVPFTRAGGGDAARALAATPLLFLGQVVAVPLLLLAFMGGEAADVFRAGPFVTAFATLVVAPLVLAGATRTVAGRLFPSRRPAAALAAVPVPALAVVLLMVAASQADAVRDAGGQIAAAAAVCAAYALLVPLVAWAVCAAMRLPPPTARTVVFSMGTRNSFVVLPLALALPEGATLAAAVVVTQTLVELTAMTGYVRLVPLLIPGGREGP